MSQIRTFKVKAFGNRDFHVEFYDSAYQVVEDCKVRKITSREFHDMRHHDIDRWHGVNSYNDALKLMETGYQPTVDKLKASIKANLSGQSKRISFHNDVVGYAPIVPLAIMGVPQSMMNSYMKPVKAKVIDVYYDMTAGCGMEANQFIDAGSKLLAAVMELEMQGYRMNIYATQNYYRDDADMLCVKVKSANQPLDLKRISFPLTHPAFFRVIGFDWYSKVPGGKYRCGYGHSVAYDFDDAALQKGFKEMFGDNAVAFSCAKIIKTDIEHIKEVMKSGSGKKTEN